nr:uncharacterized protein LOC128689521 [Cherax quadricarinatus]
MSPLPHLPKVSLNDNLPQVHVSRNPSARSGCLPFPISLRSAVPSQDQCLQESTYVTSGELPSPLPQGQRYSCHSQDHVSRNPSVYRRISSLPHLPKVSLNCMYSCLARFMYPGIHPLAPDVSPSPLTQGQPQQQPSPSSCIQESIRSLRMSSLPHFPKVGGAFPGSVSPGVHLCHLSGLPSPLPQSQRLPPSVTSLHGNLVLSSWSTVETVQVGGITGGDTHRKLRPVITPIKTAATVGQLDATKLPHSSATSERLININFGNPFMLHYENILRTSCFFTYLAV